MLLQTNRRQILKCGAAMLATLATPAFSQDVVSLSEFEKQKGARIGVYALDLQSGKTISYRADERFKLYSTFKGLLAALVINDVSGGEESFDAVVNFGKSDMQPASPVTEAALDKGKMTVRELCEAIMYRSDNTAANLLMARRGGPQRLTEFLRKTGDHVTRVDSYEGQVEGKPDIFDSTTPHAIVTTVHRLLLGNVLKLDGRRQLEAWMAGNVVGRTRLRAAFPSNWQSGDRTGTADGVCNDYAFARRPGLAPIIISAYYTVPGMALPEQEAALRNVSQRVVQWQQRH